MSEDNDKDGPPAIRKASSPLDDVLFKTKKSRRSVSSSFIHDAADESGCEEGEIEEDEEENEYVKDGFVVDDDEVEDERRDKGDDLVDSSDDGEDERLNDDDLALIQENVQRHTAAPSRQAGNSAEDDDDDGLDDFIVDDIGDGAQSGFPRGHHRGGITEEQWSEALEIFGTDYLEYSGADEHVNAERGVDSEEQDLTSEEEEDDTGLLSGDASDKENTTECRQQARQIMAGRRKARLRQAFEPAQLVKNLCTDRDDEIRMRDAPERFFDWTTPFHGSSTSVEITSEEQEEAMWIVARIPDICTEFYSLSQDDTEKRHKSILDSICNALRYMHCDKLEPDFIKRYRADYVTSPAVRENLYAIMDEDEKWDQLLQARVKVKGMLKDTEQNDGHLSFWDADDYEQYLSGLTDIRHILDMEGYLSLIKDGSDAIRQQTIVVGRKKSQRSNHDYYRRCVARGLRNTCYQFMIAPFRAGIKLQGRNTIGDENKKLIEDDNDPQQWWSPVIHNSQPFTFAHDLFNGGEVILVGSQSDSDDMQSNDPLRDCRYVAAMELAHEPRIRRILRNIFREKAVMTTLPTKKGLDTIDAFHEHYGLHLIRDKPIKEHFPVDVKENTQRSAGLGAIELRDLDVWRKQREKHSCLQYLNILKAEQAGDVVVCVHMPLLRAHSNSWYKQGPENIRNRANQDLSLLTAALEMVCVPFERDTDEWIEQRRKIVRLALTKFLLPQFEAEARHDMREAAIKAGVAAAAEKLRAMAMEGPYRPLSLRGENRFVVPTNDLPFVGVCCSSDRRDATYFASVTDRGELSDHLAIPTDYQVDDDEMSGKVVDFLIRSRPAAVLVGTGGGLASRYLARKLDVLVTEATEKWNTRFIQGKDEDDEEFEARKALVLQMNLGDIADDEDSEWKCNVELIDDSTAQLFGRSVRGEKEFPNMHVNLKCAVATARHAKDPLAELTYAWNVACDAGAFGTELFCLNIHPMQRLLPKALLLREYERVLCGAVADVGVDVNASCAHDHLLGLLSFVPGLGPRKAANLKQNIVRTSGVVESRQDLLAKRLLGPIVYNNAAAFLRIRKIEQLSNSHVNPFDDTRMHPDVYIRNTFAVRIAIESLERREDHGEKNEAVRIEAFHDVMEDSAKEVERLFNATKKEWVSLYGPTFDVAAWDPRVNVPSDRWQDKVEELDLDKYADSISQSGQGLWHSHVAMIKQEFRLPFVDPRKPMEPLTGHQLFHLLTGESDHSLRPGKELTGKVTENIKFGSRVKLFEGSFRAFIPLRNLSDEQVSAADDFVTVNSVVTGVVTVVQEEHLSVNLSLRASDLRRPKSSWERPLGLLPLDSHFDRTAATTIEEEQSVKRAARFSAKKRPGFVRRPCAHPAFRNATTDEVHKELLQGGDAVVGQALVRPSSKSTDLLSIHWVIRPGVIKVVEVVEKDKDTNAGIGKVLKIKNETYGSIDEILGRYITPMNDYMAELTSHRKFADILEDEMDAKLKEQKDANPSEGCFYNICWDDQHKGYASLRYVAGSASGSHLIGIRPNGFSWGRQTYPSVEKLLKVFKKNPRGKSSSSNRAEATVGGSSRTLSSLLSKLGEVPAAPTATRAPPTMPAVPTVGLGAASASSGGGGGWSQPPPPPSGPPPPPPFGQPPPPAGTPPPFRQPPGRSPYHQPPPPPPPGAPGYFARK